MTLSSCFVSFFLFPLFSFILSFVFRSWLFCVYLLIFFICSSLHLSFHMCACISICNTTLNICNKTVTNCNKHYLYGSCLFTRTSLLIVVFFYLLRNDTLLLTLSRSLSSADADECEEDNFGCSDICVNTHGSAHCSCPAGFALAPDGKICQGQSVIKKSCFLQRDLAEVISGSVLLFPFPGAAR